MGKSGEITGLLQEWGKGDRAAGDALTPLIYDELHRCAKRLFRSENASHTLQPTALVNEAYAKLVDVEISWQDRAHFYALAARMMKRLLINHAHARNAAKRGGDAIRVTLDESHDRSGDADAVLLDLTDALEALEKIDPRKAELIELQYFGGLTLAEMEEATGLSPATIGRDLRFARAWLKDQMTGKDE
jgi:RNA polymerase sigma factor (TIGR02999 family)